MLLQIATTQWSQVLAARDGSDTAARTRALGALCETYWEPIYAFNRNQGSAPEDAADLTQAFLADLIERGSLSDVDPRKGHFRSFLLASLKHFLSHQRDRAKAAKRGGGKVPMSLDLEGAERRFKVPAVGGRTPEELFEYRWAVTMLDRALSRLRQHSIDCGKEAQFQALKRYLTGLENHPPYRATARELGTSESAVKMAVSRLRSRFAECLRCEVAATVADPEQIEGEMRHLVSTLRG